MVDRQARLVAEPLDEVAPQPAGALAREGRDDDLVDPLVVGRLDRRGERDRDGRPGRGRRSPRSAAPRARGAAAGRPRDGRARRSAAPRSGSSPAPAPRARGPGRAAACEMHRLVRDDEHVRLGPAASSSATTWRTGMPAGRARDLADDVAAQPARALRPSGSRRRSRPAAARAARARPCRLHRVVSTTKPCAGIDGAAAAARASCRAGVRPRRDACPGRRRSRARGSLTGRDHGHVDVVARRPLSKRVEQGR